MMRKSIIRTITTSTIKGVRLSVVDGKPAVETLDDVRVIGKVNDREAVKALKDEYGKDANVSVIGVEYSENTYEISVADFLAHAKIVDKEKEEAESEQAEV